MPSRYFEIVFDIPGNQAFTYRAGEKGEAKTGKRAMVSFGKRKIDSMGYIIGERDTLPAGLSEKAVKPIRRIVDEQPVFDEKDIALARWISDFYLCGIGQAISTMIPSGRRITEHSSLAGETDEVINSSLSLSAEQQSALDAIIEPSSQKMFYLYGITGSGKTEVFLRAAEYMLSAGKSVIYLVPEISLTHQTSDIINSRFGSAAATLHSAMSPAARLKEWSRIRKGEALIVIGPRSAVFAPFQNLGLIIIDEEQDTSYKSGNTPRYHARQIAMRRCSIDGATLLMGSATPSVEAWKLMSEGKIKRLDLSMRLAGGGLPEIKPVSLNKTEGCLTKELKEEIRQTYRMGRQSILFLNRRGFAHFFHCPSCSFEQSCRYCSVSLTWHKKKNRSVCHYCGYSQPPLYSCPDCGSLNAGYRSFGTEMIEEEVKNNFPDLRIRRLDTDVTGKKGILEETLSMFRNGEIDILLGTQMVAKGLNFPGVRLVGVILADTGLHLPDFRAAERTFSLIVQVAGRAGRYFPDGKVIVQTLRMNDPVIARSCALDIEGFYSAELNHRKVLNFPPFTRLIRLNARSRDASRAEAAIKTLSEIIAVNLKAGADMLGPAECPIGIINKYHRYHIILRGNSMGSLHNTVKAALEKYDRKRDAKVYLEVDVDPVNLL